MKKIYALLATILALNIASANEEVSAEKKPRYIIIDSSKLDEDGYIREEDLRDFTIPESNLSQEEQIRIQRQIRESTRPQTNENV